MGRKDGLNLLHFCMLLAACVLAISFSYVSIGWCIITGYCNYHFLLNSKSFYLQGSLISDFDRSCTIKVFGYSSTTEYYREGSNDNRLHLVRRPLICIQAEDDPFVPSRSTYNMQSINWCAVHVCYNVVIMTS